MFVGRCQHAALLFAVCFFFFNDTATTEIYTPFPTRRSSDLVAPAVDALHGSGIAVASVATAFPSGRASLQTKLADVKEAVNAGAGEIDMVIDRGAFLAGRYLEV